MCCLSVGEPGVWREKIKLVDTHAFQHLEHLEHRLTDSCPMLLPFFPGTRWPVWADLAGKWPDLMTSTKDAPKLPCTKKTTINEKNIKISGWFTFTSTMENRDISLGIAMVWTLDCTLNTWNATKTNLLKGETDPVLGVPWFRISFSGWQTDPKGSHMARMQFMYNFNNPMDILREHAAMALRPPGVDTPAALF